MNAVLQDITNKAPYFPDTDPDTEGMQDEGRERSVDENVVADTPVGNPVAATDPNGDNLTYTLSGADAGSFEIMAASGQIMVGDMTDLDREDKNTYMVTVTATDSFGLSATTMVTIMVNNVDEEPKLAGEAPAEYAENGMDPVATFTAVDPEGADIVWSVTGTDSEDFSIENGVLMFKSPPDYERQVNNQPKTSYTVTVQASDGGTMTDTENVTVAVTNVDEPGTITLSSLQPQAGVDLTAALTDPDGTPSGTELQWERSSRTSGPWNPIEDATAVTYQPVNADADYYLRMTAEYKDPESTEDTKMAQVVSANAVRAGTNVGNTDPAFKDAEDQDITTISREIAENTPAGQPVGNPVTATDENAGDILTYTLGGGDDEASFDIDVTNGQVMTKAALNQETEETYMVIVTAIDPFGGNDTITVTITVTDVNEDPSVTAGMESVEYAEEQAITVTVAEDYSATDPEGDTPTLTVSGTDGAKFTITDAGVLTFKAAPDFEMPGDANGDNVYEIMVVATDSTGKTGTRDVTVKVTNVNEAGMITFSSVQPRVAVALTATLSDPDGGESGITWKWYRSTSASLSQAPSAATENDITNNWSEINKARSATYTPADSETVADTDVGRFLLAVASYTDGESDGQNANGASMNAVLQDITNKAPYFPDTDPDTEGMQDEGRERSVDENVVADTPWATRLRPRIPTATT